MKKQFPFYLSFLLIAGFFFAGSINASELSSRLKGKILLQVEQNGEAWYVNPDNEKRYYMGRPADAFDLMRSLGLGISNNDFDSFAGFAPSRLSGKILLKIEDSGKAYYVNPDDLKMYYLGRPSAAFYLMRELGLGISDSDLGKIAYHVDATNWKTFLDNAHQFSISYPEAWEHEYSKFNPSGANHYILLSDDTTRITISPREEPGRGYWMVTPIITNITIDGKNATRKDWHLDDESIHTYIKLTDIPNSWNGENNIIIENLQANIEVVDSIINSIEFTN